MITLRFVRHKGFSCNVVVWRAGMVGMPFIPTHVECLTPEGTCLGMFGGGSIIGGLLPGLFKLGKMEERPMGYDRDETYILDGRRCELTIDLPATDTQAKIFYDGAYASLDEPYDWSAPWGYLLPGHHHQKSHSVCSAKMLMLLRKCGFFRWPITVPAHLVAPRDLLMILSTHVEVPH